MTAQEIINYIATSEKKTPVKIIVKEKSPIDFGNAKVFGAGDKIVYGDWRELRDIITDNAGNRERCGYHDGRNYKYRRSNRRWHHD